MKKKDIATHRVIMIDDNLQKTWCSQGHEVCEIELDFVPEHRINAGNCPECVRRYVSVVRVPRVASDL